VELLGSLGGASGSQIFKVGTRSAKPGNFGPSLEGKQVVKEFDVGRLRGTVLHDNGAMVDIQYEDGDRETMSRAAVQPLLEAAAHSHTPQTRGGQPLPVPLPQLRPEPPSAVDAATTRTPAGMEQRTSQQHVGTALEQLSLTTGHLVDAAAAVQSATNALGSAVAAQAAAPGSMQALVAAFTTADPAALAQRAHETAGKVSNGKVLMLGRSGKKLFVQLFSRLQQRWYGIQVCVPDTGATISVAHPELTVWQLDDGEINGYTMTFQEAFGTNRLTEACDVKSAGGPSSAAYASGPMIFQLGDRRLDGVHMLMLDTLPKDCALIGTDLLQPLDVYGCASVLNAFFSVGAAHVGGCGHRSACSVTGLRTQLR
jgi:hypothetical protein